MGGTHDFRAFISSEDKRENTVRTIMKTDILMDNDIIRIKFIGDGFMKYQVRNMVGLLIEIASGKKRIEDVERLLLLKQRKEAIKTAPPEGLCLEKVNYWLEKHKKYKKTSKNTWFIQYFNWLIILFLV